MLCTNVFFFVSFHLSLIQLCSVQCAIFISLLFTWCSVSLFLIRMVIIAWIFISAFRLTKKRILAICAILVKTHIMHIHTYTIIRVGMHDVDLVLIIYGYLCGMGAWTNEWTRTSEWKSGWATEPRTQPKSAYMFNIYFVHDSDHRWDNGPEKRQKDQLF